MSIYFTAKYIAYFCASVHPTQITVSLQPCFVIFSHYNINSKRTSIPLIFYCILIDLKFSSSILYEIFYYLQLTCIICHNQLQKFPFPFHALPRLLHDFNIHSLTVDGAQPETLMWPPLTQAAPLTK